MVKKNIVAAVVLIAFVAILGQIFKTHILDYGILDMKTIEDMADTIFQFEAVFDEGHEAGFAEYRQDYVAESLEEEFIAVVRPTGNLVQRSGNLKQEVQILEMLRGDTKLNGQKIMLQGGNGIQHYISTKLDENDKEYSVYTDNNIYYVGVENIMYPSDTYVAFFYNEMLGSRYIPDSYELDGIFGYLKLNAEDNLNTISLQKPYTLKELEGFEFFSTSQKTLSSMYKIKNDILNELKLTGKL